MPTLETPSKAPTLGSTRRLHPGSIRENPYSIDIYGDTAGEVADLLESIRERGILVPLAIADHPDGWLLISGHRRLTCARMLGFEMVPCQVVEHPDEDFQRLAVLEYNRQRRKTFSQQMREADALETLLGADARRRRLANLQRGRGVANSEDAPERRDSDARAGRTDSTLATLVGIGAKDVFRQARAVWKAARLGDPRASAGVSAIDSGIKTVHAAHKDLRRRDRFSADFRPTPYDVWPFRHDRAYGVPHPGSIPAAIVAHALHYYTAPGDLVVDPMAGGGTVLDVAEAMGRRCQAYDLHPVRPEIEAHDVNQGFTPDSSGCALVFCDPPYHTMLARRYGSAGVGEESHHAWIAFLQQFAVDAFEVLRPGGHVALLLANQTEKDLPAGHGYIDHAFSGYEALRAAGFLPERRISCPMSGAYLPQQVRRARVEGRMLGQVRDLIVMRKPLR